MKKIVALPCICVDIFDGSNVIRPGGEELNFAFHAAGFENINVSLISSVGNDEYSTCIFDSIKGRGINTDFVRIEKNGTTAHNITYLTDGGDRYYKDNSWNGDIVDRLILTDKEKAFLKSADIVFTHLGPDCFFEVVELKKNGNFLLAVDWLECRDFDLMKKYAPFIDYFFISGNQEILPFFEELSNEFDGYFNVTLAENGSITYHHGKCYKVNACPVKEVIDTTGCGDSYHAGFVCHHVLYGDVEGAMKCGSKIASEVLGHLGGY